MDDADQGMEASAATIRDRVRRENAVTLNHQQAIYTIKLRPSNDDIYAITSSRRILFFCPPQFCSLIDATTWFQALRPVLKSAPERSSSCSSLAWHSDLSIGRCRPSAGFR